MTEANANVQVKNRAPQVPVTMASALTLKPGVQIKNRLFKSAMSEQLANEDHNPTAQLIRLYETWAEGGIGLSISGNIMVDRQQLGEPKNIVLDGQSDLSLFKQWVQAGSQNHTHFWAQLNHPGKQVPNFISAKPLAPSALPLEGDLQKNFNTPIALSHEGILNIINQFAYSAKLAKQVGFSGVQIHGAHGYLVNQFLSARHNQRDDQWGGSLDKRMAFVLAVYHAIREQVGDDFPVGIKLNSADFMKGGFSEEESLRVVQTLSEVGMDLIEVSGGSYEATVMADGLDGHRQTQKDSTIKREAYFLDYAQKARKLVDTTLVVTGGFRTSQGMNQALQSGATNMIGLARPLAVVPDFANRALADEDYALALRPLSTGIKKLDQMVLLNMSWYEAQLARIGNGKAPKKNLSEWFATLKVFLHLGVYAFRKRRA